MKEVKPLSNIRLYSETNVIFIGNVGFVKRTTLCYRKILPLFTSSGLPDLDVQRRLQRAQNCVFADIVKIMCRQR